MNERKQVVPEVAWLNINRICNYRCEWCYARGTHYSPNKEMSLAMAKDLALICREMSVQKVILIGGEPTLWKPLFEFNRYCTEIGLKTSMVTNCMLFGIDEYWERYKESPNTEPLWISAKAYDKASLRATCGVAAYDTASLGISRAAKFFDCGVSFVYNKYFQEDLIEMTKYAIGVGANNVRICPCTPAFADGVADDQYMIEDSTYIDTIVNNYATLDELTNGKLSFSMKMPLCAWPANFIDTLIEKGQMTATCQVQKMSGIAFDTDGKVLLCNVLFDYPIGTYGQDFSNSETLAALLNSDRILQYYDEINSYPSEKCIGCDKYHMCGGGCPLRWAVNTPDDVIRGWN